jgi:hypothetical protein
VRVKVLVVLLIVAVVSLAAPREMSRNTLVITKFASFIQPGNHGSGDFAHTNRS